MNAAVLTPLLSAPEQSDGPQGGARWILPTVGTLAVHGLAAALLWSGWSPELAPASPSTMTTRLVTVTIAPPASREATDVIERVPNDVGPLPQAPVVRPQEVTPPDTAQLEAQRSKAEVARRLAERQETQKQAELAEQRRQEKHRQRERLEQERLAKEAEALREQEQARRAAAERAEAQRLAAERATAERAKAQQAQAMPSESQYQPISKQPPSYPRAALDRGIEGDCTVEYTVTAAGRVSAPQVVDGACDYAGFIRPSLAAARGFRYQPHQVNGQAVAVPGVRNTFRFRIQE